MSSVSENDLKELKDLINSKFEQVNEKLNDMRVDIATLKEGQNSLNKRIDDISSSVNKRLDNLEFTNRGIFISVISGLILALGTLIIKFLSPNIFG